MKKRVPQHENHERWLVSYADFITLLFAFFVVMFASSQTDKSKAKQVSEAVTQAFENGRSVGLPPKVAKVLGGTIDEKGQGNAQMHGPGGARPERKQPTEEEVAELMPSMNKLTQVLNQELKDGKLEMHMEARGLVVSLREATFFPSGDDVVDPKAYPVVEKIVGSIEELPNSLSVEGHTDAVPIHNARFNSNWELSASRGISMLNLLQQKYGIPARRLSVVGYAETQPLASNDTLEGRARNRRVDLVIQNIGIRQAKGPVKTSRPQPEEDTAKTTAAKPKK